MTSVILLALSLFSSSVGPESVRIVLVTMDPGETLTSRFGHAAICVTSKRPSPAVCYNYGAVQARNNIAFDILIGRAVFLVRVEPYAKTMAYYAKAGRSVYAQDLPLDKNATLQLLSALRHDALPENREYLYSPFSDNCSTRLRDLIDNATSGALRDTGLGSSGSIRTIAQQALGEYPWLLLGLDLSLGSDGDAGLSSWESMFLPSELRRIVERSLGVSPRVIFQGEATTRQTAPSLLVPLIAASLVVGIFVFALCSIGGAWGVLGCVLLALALSAVWLIPMYLIFASSLPLFWPNAALLVASPLDLLTVALSWSARKKEGVHFLLLVRYLRLRCFLLIGLLLVCALGVIRQPLIPFILVCLVVVGAGWLGLRRGVE